MENQDSVHGNFSHQITNSVKMVKV